MTMPINPYFRRLLLAIGVPFLMPTACGNGESEPYTLHDAGFILDARANVSCVGTFGMDTTPRGCQSGPYEEVISKYFLLDPMDARLAALYKQCLPDLKCPVELCSALVAYQPTDYTNGSASSRQSFGSFTTCEPVCVEAPGKAVHVVYTVSGSCTGRRPEGLAEAQPVLASTAIGAFLAESARLEAASVPAFARLARELLAHDAPTPLVAAAVRALRDEIRHFEITRTLARRHGAEPQVPSVPVGETRPLEALAIENATEGCVGETFGAVVGQWQGRCAQDAGIRTAMASIAVDEAQHASLAWQIDEWAQSQLPIAARRRVSDARGQAADQFIANSATNEMAPEAVRLGGLPGAEARFALMEAMRSDLWETSGNG
jgi:hypothetical protein